VRDERDLFDMIATVFRTGVSEGHFRADADPDDYAQDFYGVILGYHHTHRLLDDVAAAARARRAFERIIASARP